jgi:hypothetical protein
LPCTCFGPAPIVLYSDKAELLRVARQALVRETYLFVLGRGPTCDTNITLAVSRADAVTSAIAESVAGWIAVASSE